MRKTVVFLAAVTAVLAAAMPAFAHEEITPKQFPTGQPTFFTLSVANEKEVDLNKITIAAPSGVKFGEATRESPGWTVNKGDTSITWSGGGVKPTHFDQWGYEIESADQPGILTYKVTLGFTDGKTDDVNVQTTAIAAGTAPTTVATVTTEATGTTPATKAASGSSARSRANIAVGLGAVALVAALVALGLAASRRGSRAGTEAGAGGSEKQDW